MQLPHRRLRPIAQRREVRDQPDVPEQHRDRAVDADREDVPEQRAPEVRPHPHLVRQREHPVGDPDAADVDAREHQGAHDREDRHRFRGAVDRRAPLLAEEEEDRGDQRAGVADADPEHEVRDVPRPADGNVETPDADALPEQPRHGHAEQAEERERRKEKHPPADRRRPLERLGDDVGDGVEVRRAQDQRRTAYDRVVEQFCFRVRHACSRSLVFYDVAAWIIRSRESSSRETDLTQQRFEFFPRRRKGRGDSRAGVPDPGVRAGKRAHVTAPEQPLPRASRGRRELLEIRR